jgi:hypothetical protein
MLVGGKEEFDNFKEFKDAFSSEFEDKYYLADEQGHIDRYIKIKDNPKYILKMDIERSPGSQKSSNFWLPIYDVRFTILPTGQTDEFTIEYESDNKPFGNYLNTLESKLYKK